MTSIKNINSSYDIISETSKLNGDFYFGEFAKINGYITGNIKSTGTISIGEKAVLKTNIEGVNIIILGEVTGDISASKSISIGSTAKIKGNISTPNLSIENGAQLEGETSMLNHHNEIILTNIFS